MFDTVEPMTAEAKDAGMRLELSAAQRRARSGFRAFVAAEIVPHAGRWDREQAIAADLPAKLAAQGYLGSLLPHEHGGGDLDMITYGLLTEEIGRACSSVRSLLTVHDMVAHAILRWGSKAQRERWLPAMARGETLGALALSEPNVGSDAKSVETVAVADGDDLVLTGHKKWTTFGQIAGLFLVFAQCEGKPTTILVERDRAGVAIEPIRDMLGTSASMLAEVRLAGCRVPRTNIVGRVGFGVSHVGAAALEQGRYSVAWGAVGIGQACLDASLRYAAERHQFGAPLAEHQLIRAMLSDMITEVHAGRLLCCRAGWLRENRDPGASAETMVAKYFCAKMASRAAADAVQIHGANGCSADYPVARYLRDAKILEIIEGSNQIQQITLSRFDYQEL
ncbi:MAG TPA: acyl-CoA dehydrogenase family protein [Thermoanaerobaculia bacterium]|nr:acyl-CoA dehydrogenase family protein [Thermoanaerobaculia bacterium]